MPISGTEPYNKPVNTDVHVRPHDRISLHPLVEELDPILLELGSSLFVCQGFEQTLVFLMAIVRMEEAGMDEGSFDSAKQTLSRDTLGKLLRALRGRFELPPDIEIEFNAALEARNWIVHRFVHDTAPEMGHAEGRKGTLMKLARLKGTVMGADKLANEVLDEYFAQFGPEVEE
jgi:hypothetical protein